MATQLGRWLGPLLALPALDRTISLWTTIPTDCLYSPPRKVRLIEKTERQIQHLSRRRLIAQLGSVALPTSSTIAGQTQHPPTLDKLRAFTSSDPSVASKWINAWLPHAKQVTGSLYLFRFADPMYALTKPITWSPNNFDSKFPTVSVPVGFVTDFASIPQLFWTLIKPDGLYAYAAVIHDYLYWFQPISKASADQIFLLGMEDFGVSKIARTAVYEAVHFFGKPAWEENERLRLAGERRILSSFPNDPLTTWSKWKSAPHVFD